MGLESTATLTVACRPYPDVCRDRQMHCIAGSVADTDGGLWG